MRTKTKNTSRYEDIINLPHHISSSRPQMPLADRAAQFSPFAALTGHSSAIKETARFTDQKVELDESDKQRLDEKLQILMMQGEKRSNVNITYFLPDDKKEGGTYKNAFGKIKKLDKFHRCIIMEDGMQIPVDEVFDIDIQKDE